MEIPQILQRRIDLNESFLMSADFRYIGKLTLNRFDSESVLNSTGLYGNRFSSMSVANQYSDYGNPYSILSAYNIHTSTPPFIILKGKFYGRLSKNKFLEGIIINPDRLVEWMHKIDLY